MRACLRAVASLLLVALLASCSAVRLAYNNAEPLVRYAAHEYFDLDEAQSGQFRERLARYHEWHRAVELPAYAALLKSAAQKARPEVSREDIAWGAEELRARYRALVRKAANDAAPILATLAPAQIEILEKGLAKNRAKYAEEFLSGDERRAHRARFKRMLERFSDWTGDLSDEQEARIERFVGSHAPLAAMRFEDRKRWHREAVALIREHRSAEALGPRLARLFTHPESRRAPEYSAALARWEADLIELILDINRTLSQEQRARVVRRMQRYAENFQALAGEKDLARAAAGP